MNPREDPRGTSGVVSSGSQRRQRAFTLVEMLTVIGLMTLLTSALWPAVQQAGRHARAGACQGQLKQWGLAFSMFLEEDDAPVLNVNKDPWELFWRPDGDRHGGSFLCPLAVRYETNQEDPLWTLREAAGCGLGSKHTAWKLASRTPAKPDPGSLVGSYGVNAAGLARLVLRVAQGRRVDRSNVPVFLDCVSFEMGAQTSDNPPAFDGELAVLGDMKRACIDRHGAGINGLFLDWSVRKIGLKELWTLDWSSFFDRHGPWTRAGGVQPEDWPAWMRAFRDN
jgi:prepilin-type processing-associated H-X9-DG protein